MDLDENDHQLLGFVELNGPDLYDIVGNQCSRSTTYIESKHLVDFHNSNAVNFL
jgi:hypothetical protein